MSAAEPTSDPGQPIETVPLRHPGRWVAVAVIAVLVAMLIHSFIADRHGPPRFGYDWHTFGKYLFDGRILRGMLVTIELTALAMAIGVAVGVVLAVMRLSVNPVLSMSSAFYVWFFRGTPVLVQVVLWYNLASLFHHLSIGIPFGPSFATASTNTLITKFIAASLGLGLNEAAYYAEIVRAGILSVDEGQTEAANALGMQGTLVMRRIVLPQAMRLIIPPTGNETISMLKTSSIVVYIALVELFTAAQNIINTTFRTIPLLLVACFWYLVMTSVLTIGQGYLERRYGRGSSRTEPKQSVIGRLLNSVRYSTPRLPLDHQGEVGV